MYLLDVSVHCFVHHKFPELKARSSNYFVLLWPTPKDIQITMQKCEKNIEKLKYFGILLDEWLYNYLTVKIPVD